MQTLTTQQHIAINEMQKLQDAMQTIYEQANFSKPFSVWLQACANAQRNEENELA